MATETLRPNAAGDEEDIPVQNPPTGPHWEKVDEVSSDGLTTCVFSSSSIWRRDLYQLGNHVVGSGVINFVRVITICAADSTPEQTNLRISLKSGGVLDDSASKTTNPSWLAQDEYWYEKPGGGAWGSDWSVIDSLQAGLAIREPIDGEADNTYCTLLRVEVDYTPPAETEKTSSDTGSGADTKAIGNPLATFPVRAETGGGVDGHKAVAPQSAGESGSGVDALTALLGILSRSETGLGTDAKLSLAVALIKADAGSGLETILGRAITLADLGSGLDLSGKEKAGSDSGVGSDAILGLLGRLSTDYGYGADTSKFGDRPLLVFDTGIGIESSLLRDLGEPKYSSDVGGGIDASILAGLLAGADGGAATEAITLLAAVLAGDNGQGVEALVEVTATFKEITNSDAGQGMDEVLSYLRKLADSGQGEENLHLVGYVGRRMRMKVYQRDAFNLAVYTSETGK